MRDNIIAVKIAAPNDASGNPQRGWIITAIGPDYSEPWAFVDEGYEGPAALRSAGYGEVSRTGYVLPVSQAEYRRWLKWYTH